MTVLVTGGMGYIGSHTCVELLNQGMDVVIIDNLVNSSAEAGKRIERISGRSVTFYEADVRDRKTLDRIFRKMHESIRADSVFGNYRASGYLYDFLIEFYRLISENKTSQAPNSALMKALDYINENYTSAVSMDDLCTVCGVSKQYLCLLFRKILGSRPMEYIAKRRIQAAKELLTGTDMRIEEIAAETGFCTASYFCKLFKRYEGITPSAFRNEE